MKRRNTSISLVSTFLVFAISAILLISFALLSYNQYKTNQEILNAISQVANSYATNDADSYAEENSTNPDESIAADETTATINNSDDIPHKDTDAAVTDSKSKSMSKVEYSSAIAYLAKLQEVCSINNTSSLLALVYTVLSSLILTYGAKMLRLGENDKENLVQELTEKSLERISDVETHMLVKSSITNAVVAINSTTSLLQLLMQNLSNNKTTLVETINSSLMDSFLDMCDQLSATQKIISKCRYKNADISSLECAMKLFEPSFDIYKSLDLPPNINDKACAEKKVNEIMKTYQKIAKYTQK